MMEKGSEVIIDNGREGVVIGQASSFLFSDGKAHYIIECANGLVLVPYDTVKPKETWEKVEGKLRLVHVGTGELCTDPIWSTGPSCGSRIPTYVERLVEK